MLPRPVLPRPGLRTIGRHLAALWRAAVPPAPDPRPPTPRRYDVEADWQLLNTCNYRCAYCFFPPDVLGEKLRPRATPAEWEAAFAATGRTWLLHITGGEPSLYPGLAELCARLTRTHLVSLNSNLTGPGMAALADRVDPARVMFINAGLHGAERAARGGLPIFLRHAGRLLDRGFPLFVSAVATPALLADPEPIMAMLRPLGLVPFPKLLQGPFEGRRFPADYTVRERQAFRDLAAAARAAAPPWLSDPDDPPTIGLDHDEDFLDGLPSFLGRPCGAGERFVRLHGDGDVFRCNTHAALGNLLDGTLALWDAPTPCDASYCFYFCRKYAAPAGA